MRLIDADEVRLQKGFFEKMTNVPKFYEWLDSLPTIDAVPVVRCKECKYSDTLAPDCTEATFPLKCLSIRYGGVYPDWFCEHGERKDGAE